MAGSVAVLALALERMPLRGLTPMKSAITAAQQLDHIATLYLQAAGVDSRSFHFVVEDCARPCDLQITLSDSSVMRVNDLHAAIIDLVVRLRPYLTTLAADMRRSAMQHTDVPLGSTDVGAEPMVRLFDRMAQMSSPDLATELLRPAERGATLSALAKFATLLHGGVKFEGDPIRVDRLLERTMQLARASYGLKFVVREWHEPQRRKRPRVGRLALVSDERGTQRRRASVTSSHRVPSV
jgi:hypothetical protein